MGNVPFHEEVRAFCETLLKYLDSVTSAADTYAGEIKAESKYAASSVAKGLNSGPWREGEGESAEMCGLV